MNETTIETTLEIAFETSTEPPTNARQEFPEIYPTRNQPPEPLPPPTPLRPFPNPLRRIQN